MGRYMVRGRQALTDKQPLLAIYRDTKTSEAVDVKTSSMPLYICNETKKRLIIDFVFFFRVI